MRKLGEILGCGSFDQGFWTRAMENLHKPLSNTRELICTKRVRGFVLRNAVRSINRQSTAHSQRRRRIEGHPSRFCLPLEANFQTGNYFHVQLELFSHSSTLHFLEFLSKVLSRNVQEKLPKDTAG